MRARQALYEPNCTEPRLLGFENVLTQGSRALHRTKVRNVPKEAQIMHACIFSLSLLPSRVYLLVTMSNFLRW